MAFEKLLRKRKIEKVVDPGSGRLFEDQSLQDKKLPGVETKLNQTPPAVIVNDLSIYAENVAADAESAALEILEANKTDPDYLKYHDLVVGNRFNPQLLLQNPNARPNLKATIVPIRAAEKKVFKNSNDPRAPFTFDLYRIADEANLIGLTMKKIWSKIVNPTPLYSEFKYNNLVQMALDAERENLDLLSGHVGLFRNNTAKPLTKCFVNHITDNVLNAALSANDKGLYLTEAVENVRQMIFLLNWGKSFHFDHWSKVQTKLINTGGEVLSRIGERLVQSALFSVVGGVQSRVFEFSEDLIKASSTLELTNLSGDVLGPALDECFDLHELRSQIQLTLQRILGTVEDSLVNRLKVNQDMDENRNLAVLVSQRNNKTNQLLRALEELSKQLDILRSQAQFDYNEASTRIKDNLNQRLGTIGVVPFNPNA